MKTSEHFQVFCMPGTKNEHYPVVVVDGERNVLIESVSTVLVHACMNRSVGYQNLADPPNLLLKMWWVIQNGLNELSMRGRLD